jgi:hypothetical protein
MRTRTQDEATWLPGMNGLAIKKNTYLKHCSRLLPLLVTLFLSGGAWAVDFKGVKLGGPLFISVEQSVFGALDCNPMQLDPDEYQRYLQELQQIIPGARKICTGATSIAAIPAEATVVLGASRRVLRLTFQFAAENYPQVLTAMMEKWGEGVEEVREENDKSVWWDFDDGISVSVHLTPSADAFNSTDDILLVGLAEYSLPVTTPAGDL